MKGSLNLQIDYDTSRFPSGDNRFDFVTKVKGDPILDQLSLAERQAFDNGIAHAVNEMLAGVNRILIPKEEWLFEDIAKILYGLKEFMTSKFLQYPDWRETIVIKAGGIDEIWKNVEPAVIKSLGEEFSTLLKFPDAKIKLISQTYLKNILNTQLMLDNDVRFSIYDTESLDELINFVRKTMEVKPESVIHGYRVAIVADLLKSIYSFTHDELIFLLNVNEGHLKEYLEGENYVKEDLIKDIAQRADVDPNVFLSQVIATAKMLEAKEHERD